MSRFGAGCRLQSLALQGTPGAVSAARGRPCETMDGQAAIQTWTVLNNTDVQGINALAGNSVTGLTQIAHFSREAPARSCPFPLSRARLPSASPDLGSGAPCTDRTPLGPSPPGAGRGPWDRERPPPLAWPRSSLLGPRASALLLSCPLDPPEGRGSRYSDNTFAARLIP